MEISTYKSMCDKMGLNEISKKRIFCEVLRDAETEKNTEHPGAQEENRGQTEQTKGNIRIFRKKRFILLAAVIALMSSITVVAGYISERTHYQQKVHIGEDGIITFADNKTGLSKAEETQPVDGEIGNVVSMKVLEGESLEAAIDELQIEPYLPISGAEWKVEEYTVKVQEQSEVLESGTSERYYLGVGYRNAENPEQFVGLALSVCHSEMAANVTDSITVTVMPGERADNYRTYIDTAGREYALYDMSDPEEGKMEIHVDFTYSDRYLLNEITGEQAHDYYVCMLVCQNMSDKEIYEFLDSLVTYTP